MKKIAVIVPSFTIEYSQDFLDGVVDYFNQRDVKLIIAQTQIPNNETGLYDYQFWNIVNVLAAKEIDAYIIPLGLYTVKRTIEQLQKVFSKFADRPVICSAEDIHFPKSYLVDIDSHKSFEDIVSHLKNVHGCKNIAFMSANSTNSFEALDRFEAFKEALKNNNLEFNPDFVFDGYFTDFGAHDNLLQRLQNSYDVKFDAIVCANDNMAVGSIKALKELELEVPKDVIVTGFDDSPLSFYSIPKISTVNQDIYSQGRTCAELTDKIVHGEGIQKTTKFYPSVKFRQSCGCFPINDIDAAYKTPELKTFQELNKTSKLLAAYENNTLEKMNITTMLDMIRSSNTLRQFFYNLKYLAGQSESESLYVSLFNVPIYITKEELPELPENIELYMYADNPNNKEVFNPETIFNLKERIFPPEADEESAGIFIAHPIFAGEALFGYFTAKITNTKFTSYQAYFKILSSSISQSYEYTKKLIQNEELSSEVTQLSDLAKTDELTGLLNRRGFMELGQRTIDILQEISNAGVVFFGDMDGLKKINDTYGHKMGDKAIQIMGQVFQKVFRTSDIIGHLSGDEFAVVANGMLISKVDYIRQKIVKYCDELSQENNLPFTLSVSLGAVDLESGSSLMTLLSNADKLMYKEKKAKKTGKK